MTANKIIAIKENGIASARKPSLIGCWRSSEEAIVEAIYISEREVNDGEEKQREGWAMMMAS